MRPLNRWTRGLLYATGGLFVLAGIQLALLSGATDTYFAWTLAPPLAAASLGGAFFAAAVGQFIAARQKTWAAARVAVPWLWAISIPALAVTFAHTGEFHFSSPDLAPRFAAWLWVATFAGTAVAALLSTWALLRIHGRDPPRDATLPRDMRITILVQTAMFGINGAMYLAVPGLFFPAWPYPPTYLAVDIIGAGFVGFAVLMYHACRENDLTRVRPLGGLLTIFAILQLAVFALFAGQARWGSPMTWLFVVWMVTLLPVGTHALLGRKVLGRRSEREEPAAQPSMAGASVRRVPLEGERPWFRLWPPGVPRSLDYPEILASDLLRETARRYPGRTAVRFYSTTLTYKECDDAADRFANGLRKLGVRPGDRVSLPLPNTPHILIALNGAWRTGAVVVQTNPLYTPPELEKLYNDARVETVVTMDLFWPTFAEVRPKTHVKHIVVCRMEDFLGTPLRQLYGRKKRNGLKKAGHWPLRIPDEPWVHHYKDVAATPAVEIPDVPRDPDGIAALQYTGGTTGLPKGAMLTHANLVAGALQSAAWWGPLEGQERGVGSIPAFHIYGLHAALMSTYRGSEIILEPNPRDFGHILKLIDRNRATYYGGSPTMYIALLRHPKSAKYDLRSLKVCSVGSAALPSEVRKEIQARIGGRITEGYGLSEATPAISGPCTGPQRTGIGFPVCDTDVIVVDAADPSRAVAPGEVGEFAIRGPQVMKGYWNRPEETAHTLRDGWLLTGDLGRMEADGSFTVVERKKDMINASGFKIYPLEVEEVLFAHPAVSEAAVVGVPDPYRGETVKAFVVLRSGATAKADDLITFCRERLTPYKVPKLLEFVSDLPKSNVGKVLRRELRERERAKVKPAR